jgi:hypothetical protein
LNYPQTQKQPFSIGDKVSLFAPKFVLQLLVGAWFIALYLLEVLQGPTIALLTQMQQNEIYKQITGFLLFAYVLCQWRLAWLRMSRAKVDNKRELNLHMWLGVFAPLALYVHSSQLGYGYQALLVGLFLFNVLMGLCSPKLLKIRYKTYVVVWLVVHSGIAVLVPLLLMFHLYVVYFYD